MLPSIVIVAAALGLANAANNLNPVSPRWSLNKRQGESFRPGENTGFGETCVEAFGPGFIECRPASATDSMLCINPDLGHTCCSNLWGCPADSFCLVDGLCCPTGLDPVTCAAENGVSLPPNFGATTTSTPEDTATATATATVRTTTTEATATSGIAHTTSTTRAPIHGTGSFGNGTATRTATTSRPVVTAGAYKERAGIAAVVLGLGVAIIV